LHITYYYYHYYYISKTVQDRQTVSVKEKQEVVSAQSNGDTAFSDYNGYWTTADAQNHRLPVRGLFNLQAGHVTDWTTRGLDRSWTSQVVNQDNSRVGRLVDITATSFHNLV